MIIDIDSTKYQITREENILHFRSRDKKADIRIDIEPTNINPSIIFPHWKRIAEYIKSKNLPCDIDDELKIEIQDDNNFKFSLGKIESDLIFGDWVVPAQAEEDGWDIIEADSIFQKLLYNSD